MALFSAWASVDPEAAMEASMNIESGHDRSLANFAIARALLDTDPNQAFEVLASGEGQMRGWRYNALFAQWAGKDPAGALAKIESLGGDPQQCAPGYIIALGRKIRNLRVILR